MSSEWIKSPMAARVLAHWADPRPAWLWTADGSTIAWRNGAATLFGAKLKKHGVKRAPDPAPLRGQIARLIRLGIPNRASLSRMQFLLGEKPISATCSCTPLMLSDGQQALLVVAVDPIDANWLDDLGDEKGAGGTLLPAGTDYLLFDKAGEIKEASKDAGETYGALIAETGLPDGTEPVEVALGEDTLTLTRREAGPDGSVLLLISRKGWREAPAADTPPAPPREPLLPLGLPPVPDAPVEDVADDHWVPPLPEAPSRSLSSLFDRLAENEELYAPLTDADDPVVRRDEGDAVLPPPADAIEVAKEPDAPGEDQAAPQTTEPDTQHRTIDDLIAEVETAEEDSAVRAFVSDGQIDEAAPETVSLFRITGRGLTPHVAAPPEQAPEDDETERAPPMPVAGADEAEADAALETLAADAPQPPSTHSAEPDRPQDLPPGDPEAVERVSRYNFDELSRILTDRVGTDTPARIEADPSPPRRAESAQINLASETFVLNRLPLAILVFRDQQVLFANRALTEMTGHDGIESLRRAGLASIFPPAEQAGETGGPVSQLLRSDGMPVSVTARLQSIPWHGRPALMLSASLAETRVGHEIAVKSFAEMLAAARDEGFVSADRSGVINQVTAPALALLDQTEADLVGKPLTVMLEAQELPALKAFLERPARFAETARPSLLARGVAEGSEVLLFAEGQAGIVSGYFGFLRKTADSGPRRPKDDADPALLGRVSRGVRRPLNTVIGFSDLIGAAAFGPIDNPRYVEYARDIKSAGQEIAALVDELDDYARLKDGRYAPRPADIDLVALLESCVVRVRGQANAARVLVRSGISERIPRIVADRASLGQAVLNLLASAIDQTPVGGSVVLSAQSEDDGSVAIHVRDSGAINVDMTDRFVVFRDGVGRDGEALAPVRSSVGLALTRSLLAVNGCSLSMDPTAGQGTLFTLVVPRDLVAAS